MNWWYSIWPCRSPGNLAEQRRAKIYWLRFDLKAILGKQTALTIDPKIATVPQNTHAINMFFLGLTIFATWPCQYHPTVLFWEFLRVLKNQGAEGWQHQLCPCITYTVYRCWVILNVFLKPRWWFQRVCIFTPISIVSFRCVFLVGFCEANLVFFCCPRAHVSVSPILICIIFFNANKWLQVG